MLALFIGIMDLINKTLPAGFKLAATLRKPSGEIEVFESLDASEAATDQRVSDWQKLIDDAQG